MGGLTDSLANISEEELKKLFSPFGADPREKPRSRFVRGVLVLGFCWFRWELVGVFF